MGKGVGSLHRLIIMGVGDIVRPAMCFADGVGGEGGFLGWVESVFSMIEGAELHCAKRGFVVALFFIAAYAAFSENTGEGFIADKQSFALLPINCP